MLLRKNDFLDMAWTKRFIRNILLPVMLLWIAAFCGCARVQEEDDRKTDWKEEREEIVLWTYYETKMQKASMDELVNGFNGSQEDYHLTWEYHGPVTEFNKRLAIAITQNQLPDMVILDNPDMPSYIKMDKLEDITEEVKKLEKLDEYFPSAVKSVKSEGRYYGLPFCCNNVVLIYNQDILKKEGIQVPQTWEELKEAAAKLSVPGRYGFAMSAVSGEQGAFQFGAFMLSAGDSLKNAGGAGTLRAFQFIRDMAEHGWMPRDCVNWSQNDVARIFIDGKCAMMENGPWVFPALDASGIHYGIAAFPAGEERVGLLGGEDIAVIKGKNVQGSIAFFKYYSQLSPMLNANLMANSLPPRRDVAELSLKVNPEYRVVLSQMEDCISRTECDNWAELSAKLADGQYRVITGESTPKEVCREIRALKKNMQGSSR